MSLLINSLECPLKITVNRLASSYRLDLVYKKEFHDVFQEEQDTPEFGPLLKRLGVVNNQNESSMDEDQWDAASKCSSKRGYLEPTSFIIRRLSCICF